MTTTGVRQTIQRLIPDVLKVVVSLNSKISHADPRDIQARKCFFLQLQNEVKQVFPFIRVLF
jgi:hypothetical protein